MSAITRNAVPDDPVSQAEIVYAITQFNSLPEAYREAAMKLFHSDSREMRRLAAQMVGKLLTEANIEDLRFFMNICFPKGTEKSSFNDYRPYRNPEEQEAKMIMVAMYFRGNLPTEGSLMPLPYE